MCMRVCSVIRHSNLAGLRNLDVSSYRSKRITDAFMAAVVTNLTALTTLTIGKPEDTGVTAAGRSLVIRALPGIKIN